MLCFILDRQQPLLCPFRHGPSRGGRFTTLGFMLDLVSCWRATLHTVLISLAHCNIREKGGAGVAKTAIAGVHGTIYAAYPSYWIR